MLPGLRLFKRKKKPQWNNFRNWRAGVFFKTGVLKNTAKITGKHLRRSLFLTKQQAQSNFFTGDCFSNLLELSMVFGPVKNSSENEYISQKTESQHQAT